MDKLGIKATLYDVLGYITPGAIFIIGAYFCIYPIEEKRLPLLLQGNISISTAVIGCCASYLIGHILSSIGSAVFENRISISIFSKIYEFNTDRYDKRSVEIFGKKYTEIGSRTPMSYCQKNTPEIYETAFSFLTIYGFCRNSAISLLLLIPLIIHSASFNRIEYSAFAISVLFLMHQYMRFKSYYMHQIASSLMIK